MSRSKAFFDMNAKHAVGLRDWKRLPKLKTDAGMECQSPDGRLDDSDSNTGPLSYKPLPIRTWPPWWSIALHLPAIREEIRAQRVDVDDSPLQKNIDLCSAAAE